MDIDPTARLRECPDDQIGTSIPKPLNARLDALVARAHAAGENTSRREVIAALVLQAPEAPELLVEAVRAYRSATADEAIPAGDDPANILGDRRPRRGPRPRRAAP